LTSPASNGDLHELGLNGGKVEMKGKKIYLWGDCEKVGA